MDLICWFRCLSAASSVAEMTALALVWMLIWPWSLRASFAASYTRLWSYALLAVIESIRPTWLIKLGAISPSVFYLLRTFATMNPLLNPKCNFRPQWSFLLSCLWYVQRTSSWITRPILSMTNSTIPLGLLTLLSLGFIVLLLRERVVWSGIFNPTFIRQKMGFKKPSVCLSGNLNRSLKVSAVSMARSEYSLGPPILWSRSIFQDLMTSS